EFSPALTQQDGGNAAKAQEAFAGLSDKGPAGYRVLSRFQLAATAAPGREQAKAVGIYDELAASADTDSILKGLATIQAATLRLDDSDYAELEGRVNGRIRRRSTR